MTKEELIEKINSMKPDDRFDQRIKEGFYLAFTELKEWANE